jgi:methyl-accepting chemotaxis protein
MNRRQRKAREAYERQKETYEFIKQKEAEEKKKSDLISSLKSAKSELSKEQAEINSCINLCIKEHVQRLEEKMREFVMEVKENLSTEPPRFQIDESFTSLVSDSNLKLKEISEQIEFIDGLIRKVSSDSPDISLSEYEQKIIKILSANSFFRSQDVASVQKMIDSCPNMRDCLERLKTYSDQFLSKMGREIRIHATNPNEFKVDSKWLELKHQKLEELLQELSEINEEIEKGKNYFSTKSFVECIFSKNFDEFSSIFENIQTLGDRIKEMNKRFSEIKKSLVEFVEHQIYCRKAFASEVYRDFHRFGYNSCSDGEDVSSYEEPIVGLRRELLSSLNQIKEIRL